MATSTSPPAMGRKPYGGPIYQFDHPTLGSLTGRRITSPQFPGASNVQFRSIPYAQVPKRFVPCLPLTSIPQKFDNRPHRDFTQYGAACPQRDGVSSAWFDCYGGPLEDDKGFEFDEFTCLTVTVSVPESQLSGVGATGDLQPLPVLVYVHGGGLQEGCGHVDGLHSNANLAAYASSIDLPIITVNIGYRLNFLGSLVCQDMVEEYQKDPSTSAYGPFNLSLQDQRAAFSWIQKFIGGFGGNADNVTAFGDSAGSISLAYHICGSSERVFKRAILQSGVIFGHTSFEDKEEEYQALLKHFKIQGSTASERLENLRRVPAKELALRPARHILPFVEELPCLQTSKSLFARGSPTFLRQMSLVPTCPWLEDIIIGDDFWEGYVLRSLAQNMSPAAFVKSLFTNLPQQHASRVLDAYHMPRSTEAASQVDSNFFWTNLSFLLGDLMLSAPIHKLTNALALHNAMVDDGNKRKIYRYMFGLSNPFPGSDHSYVTGHHFIEIIFVFLNFLDRFPRHRGDWHHQQAKNLATKWIMFANGQEPWPEYVLSDPSSGSNDDAKVAVSDDIRGWHIKTLAQDEQESKSDPWGPRRYAAWRALEEAFEALREPGMEEDTWAELVDTARVSILSGVAKEPDQNISANDGRQEASSAKEKVLEAEQEVTKVV